MESQNIEFINIDKLKLDKENPRLPSNFKHKDLSQKDIINWMLGDASIIELMLAIGNSGFFIGEALLVIQSDAGEYTVVEGNRRLTSALLLSNPDLANLHKKKIEKVLNETLERPTDLPCIIFQSRSDINKYLGYRHVTGVKSWGILQKARYLSELKNELTSFSFHKQCRELAKSIGSRSDHVRKLLIAYGLYEMIEDNGFFGINGLDETTIYFNYFSDSLSRDNIRRFIGIDIGSDTPFDEVNIDNLKELTKWFFERNDQNKTRLIGDSKHLSMLDAVLGDSEARDYFQEGKGSINDAYQIVSVSGDSFFHEIELALAGLKRAQSILHNVEDHTNSGSVKSKLREIFSLAKNMKTVIEASDDEGWND
ncbi:hypothetical protein [Pseudidiomarina sp.]|uniref:hypothetical protein n=1 Tax=Pseudidiomarina sp. TaxID=2081707 RepID=UPI003A97DA47